jgi:lysosomal acid lipase/cholesteryl ester hydrolase
MAQIPLIGRLSPGEYSAIFFGFFFLAVESLVRLIVTFILPKPVVDWFYERSRSLFKHFVPSPLHGSRSRRQFVENVRTAQDFGELCAIWGYKFEEHVVLTKDGYLLGLHRLCTPRTAQRTSIGVSSNKPVAYLHHGLLMNSEVWICLTDVERSLPFQLVERGWDVFLGNKEVIHVINQSPI